MQVAAVFDVGLRAASPKTIHRMMPLEFSGLTPDQVKCYLHKLKLYRLRSLGETIAMRGAGQCLKHPGNGYYEDGAAANDQQHTYMRFQREVKRRGIIALSRDNIRKQAKMIEQALLVLADFQREVEGTMGRQHQLYDMLRLQLQQLSCIPGDAVITDAPVRTEQAHRPFMRALEKTQLHALLPQRAQMEKEMQDHMDMHRTMVLHMDSQLAQFDGQGDCVAGLSSFGDEPGLEGQGSGDWNALDDILEDQVRGVYVNYVRIVLQPPSFRTKSSSPLSMA